MLESRRGKSNKKICYVVTVPMTIRAFFVPQLRCLAQHGYEVTVVCSEDHALSALLGEKIRYIPVMIPRGISAWGTVRAIWDLCRLFRRERYDMVQYSTPNAAFCAAAAAFAAGIQVRNYHLMGFRFLGASGAGRMVLRSLEKISCMLSTHIECVSRSNLALGVREGLFPEEKATVVWNGSSGGVDLVRFDFDRREQWRKEVRTELSLADTDYVFGFAGRITRDKGINELLQAFLDGDMDAKLLLIGAKEGLDTLDTDLLERAQCHPDVMFHDSVSDIERYYAAMDVLLLPSYREGFGNVVIEGAAMGTPAIISDIPGPIDAVEADKTAVIVPPRDAKALQNAMERCLNGEIRLDGQYCQEYVKTHYDGQVLCEKILLRKRDLLGE